ATPIEPSVAEDLRWFFRERQHRQEASQSAPDERFRSASIAYRAPRFSAVFRRWLQDGDTAISAAQSFILRDALERGEGRVEFVNLTRQYFHLSSLVGVA